MHGTAHPSLAQGLENSGMLSIMEIEAKYTVGPDELTLLAGLRSLGPYTLVAAPEPELQQNTYFDTVDGRLAAARHGLRLRRVGPRSLVTLKGPTTVSPAGVHQRVEFEFPGDDPHPQAWPPGEARELGLALTGGAPLRSHVAVETERHIRYVERAGVRVAELCLDRGVVRAGGREQPFSELEIELLAGGEAADLEALATALATLIPLRPEPRTKLQRALALLDTAAPPA